MTFISRTGWLLALAVINAPVFAQDGQIKKEKFHWGIITQDTSYGYAGVVRAGNILYLSGVTAPGNFPTQVKSVYTTLENNLKRFGATFRNVVKENLFTTSIDSMKKYSYIRKPFYNNDYPAASWIGIKELFVPDRMLEVELVAHLPQPDPKFSLPASDWPGLILPGVWMMNSPRGQILETWETTTKDVMTGRSYRIRDKDTTLMETVRLIRENNEVFYVPTVVGQNDGKAVRFRMTSSNNNIFVFENPDHDYPKRVVYDFKNREVIHAWIDAGETQKEKRSDYFFHRIH